MELLAIVLPLRFAFVVDVFFTGKESCLGTTFFPPFFLYDVVPSLWICMSQGTIMVFSLGSKVHMCLPTLTRTLSI